MTGQVSIGDIISLRGLALAVPLAAGVILFGWWYNRRAKARPQKPGQCLIYMVPGRTAAQCRGLLGKHAEDDIFAYTLEGAASGGWYIHLTRHNPTEQGLDTLFLLQFLDEEPAAFSLRFVREAFGMKEPVMAEELLDEFFAQKLGAQRAASPTPPSIG